MNNEYNFLETSSLGGYVCHASNAKATIKAVVLGSPHMELQRTVQSERDVRQVSSFILFTSLQAISGTGLPK